MRGADQLIAFRRRGHRPAFVWVDTDHDSLRCWRDWPSLTPGMAHLQIEPTDQPGLLDLRCLIGLDVLVQGTDADRVQAIADACRDAEASRVMAAVCSPDESRTVECFTDTLEAAHG